MARMDVQLDKLSGDLPIRIEWDSEGDNDTELLRAHLVQEIAKRDHRIVLDLRAVKGAPEPLIELLLAMRRYARSKGKLLSMNWMLPELRKAMDQRGLSRLGKSVAPSRADPDKGADKSAQEVLKEAEGQSDYDIKKAQRIDRKRSNHKHERRMYYIKFAAVVLGLTLCVVAAEAWYLFGQEESIQMPRKTYEK